MEIKIELNEKQEKALNEVLPKVQSKVKPTPELLAKQLLITFIIQHKQQELVQELKM